MEDYMQRETTAFEDFNPESIIATLEKLLHRYGEKCLEHPRH